MRNSIDLYNDLLPVTDEKLKEFVEYHCADLKDKAEIAETIFDEVKLTVFEGMDGNALLDSLILVAIQNIQQDPDFDIVGTRFLLTKAYLTSVIEYTGEDFDKAYRESFVKYIQWGVDEGLLDKRMVSNFNLYELALELSPSRDEDFTYLGLSTAMNRYMVKHRGSTVVRETPQFMWMRVGMGMALKEEEPNKYAKQFYNKLSKKEYTAGGSTMIGAGTVWPTLANCFLLNTDDTIEHIFENITNIGLISKGTGGIGIGITKLRAEGSPIKTNNTFSSGPIPFAKIMDSTVAAIARAGKKKGAVAIYMENWHLDFYDFLDLRQNAGDDYRRTRIADTAVYISDEFMKRVINSEDWYMFDPAETQDLTELYGSDFSKRYLEYVEKAEAGEMRVYKKVPAREQMQAIVTMLMSTSHPWITFKDTINVRALNNNTGTIHNSNLCTEVCLPQDKENIAVCNLAYINLARHIDMDKCVFGGSVEENMKSVDWVQLKDSVRIGMRHLDNLIDVGMHPVKEAEHSDLNNRAVGLGIMGLAELYEIFGYAYDSEEAYEVVDQLVEYVSYESIAYSCDLADERGKYPNFNGSMWSRGYVPFDTIEILENDRGATVRQNRTTRLDWDKLRERVKNGVRNATTMMIAPNGNSSLTAGTSPGIDPRFALIFSRTTMNGKFLDINVNLVNALKKLGIWEDVRNDLLENQGEISEIDAIPDSLKEVYKTCFQISPLAFLEVASRAQKWIDQAMSRNMYLESRDPEENMEVYIEAWRRGLKTTYYLHMKPRHTAEQSSVKVNKGKALGMKGFGASSEPESSPESSIEKPVEKGTDSGKPKSSGFGGFGKRVDEAEGEKKESKEAVEEPKKKVGFGRVEVENVEERQKGGNDERETESKKGFHEEDEVVDDEVDDKFESESDEESSHVADSSPLIEGSAEIQLSLADSKEPPVEAVKSEEADKKKDFKQLFKACPIDPIERAACDSCS